MEDLRGIHQIAEDKFQKELGSHIDMALKVDKYIEQYDIHGYIPTLEVYSNYMGVSIEEIKTTDNAILHAGMCYIEMILEEELCNPSITVQTQPLIMRELVDNFKWVY